MTPDHRADCPADRIERVPSTRPGKVHWRALPHRSQLEAPIQVVTDPPTALVVVRCLDCPAQIVEET